MAKIRQYQSQVSQQGGLRTQASPATFGSQLGQSVQQMGQGVSQIARQMQERKERQAQLENERILSEERIALQQQFEEAQRNAPPGAPDFTENFLEGATKRFDELLENRPTRAARDHMEQNLLRLKGQFASQAINFQSEAGARYEVQQVEETVQNSVNAVRADPALIDDVLGDVDRLSSELPVPASAREKFRQDSRPNVGFASVMGRLDVVEAPAEAQDIEQELLEGDRWKDLLTNSQYQQALNRARSLNEALTAQLTQEFTSGFAEQKRQWERGLQLDSDRYGPEEIAEFIPDAETREEMLYQADHSRRVGAQSNWMRTASPREIAARHQELAAKAASPIEREGEFDETTREMEAFQQAFEQRRKAIENDRAGYVRDNSERVNQLYRQMVENPGEDSLDKYVAATISEQTRMGIPAHEVYLLPKEYLAEVSQRLDLADLTPEGAQEFHRSLRALHTEYGDHWPLVQRQLEAEDVLSGPHAVAASLTGPLEVRPAQNLIRATATGRDTLKDQVDRPGLETELREGLTDQMADFAGTLQGQAGGGRVYDQYRESLEHLTLYYMSQGESNMGRAMQRSYEELIDSRFEVAGTFMVPRDIPQSASQIQRGARKVQDNLESLDLVIPFSATPGLRPEDAKSAWVSSLRDDGYWTQNGDQSGIMLVDPTGSPVLVRGRDGQPAPLERAWSDLASGNERRSIQQRVTPNWEGAIR